MTPALTRNLTGTLCLPKCMPPSGTSRSLGGGCGYRSLSVIVCSRNPLIQTLVERRREKTFETLVDALVPQVPVTPELLKEAEMAGGAGVPRPETALSAAWKRHAS